jgi:hypothetical protein
MGLKFHCSSSLKPSAFQMLIGLNGQTIGNLQVALLYTWGRTLFHGALGSKTLCQDEVQKWNTRPWKMRRLR